MKPLSPERFQQVTASLLVLLAESAQDTLIRNPRRSKDVDALRESLEEHLRAIAANSAPARRGWGDRPAGTDAGF